MQRFSKWKCHENCVLFFLRLFEYIFFYALSSGMVMSLSYFGCCSFKFQLLVLYTPLLPSLCYIYVNETMYFHVLCKQNSFCCYRKIINSKLKMSSCEHYSAIFPADKNSTSYMVWKHLQLECVEWGDSICFSNLTNLHNSIDSFIAEKAFLYNRTTPTILRICVNFTQFF